MAATLAIDIAAGADPSLALKKLQTIVDGAVAPQTTLRVLNLSNIATVSFPDAVAEEQVLACFNALVNIAGLPESGMVPSTISLTGAVSPGSRQRVYSV